MNLTHWIPPHNINHVHHCPGLLFKFILVPRLLALVFWPIVVLTNMIGSGTVWVKRSFWVGIGHNISTYLYDIQCMLFLGICLQTSVKRMPQNFPPVFYNFTRNGCCTPAPDLILTNLALILIS